MLLLAAALRFASLDAGWFGVDQARDVTWAELIASGRAYPTLGPLMRNRFYLGATYYYFWSLPSYVLTGPLALYVYAGVLGTATVAVVWRLARRTCGVTGALAATALFATSPVAVIDARIAWAPAALPLWTAVLLVAAASFLRRPSAGRAASLLFVAALGTQLHLAAVPLAVVAGGIVLGHVRALSGRGLLAAAVVGAVPLLPMLAGLAEPLPHGTVVASGDPRASRIADVLLLVPRMLEGLSPAVRPRLVDVWLAVEGVTVVATLVAALIALLRPRTTAHGRELRLGAGLLLAAVAAVLLLPAEAWYYYLDTTLVPGAIVLGAAWESLRPRRAALWLLCAVVLARTLLLVWWIHGAASSGFVATNLDFLRLGGPRPADPDARARVLDVATKAAASRIVAEDVGLPVERVWRDAHGSGFADLDGDNGYFLRRAADEVQPNHAAPPTRSVVVFHRGDFPEPWLAKLEPARFAGPLEIRAYEPSITAASLVGCGEGPLPEAQPPSPTAYGAGERAWPSWPCAGPRVDLMVAPSAPDVAVRVFARVDGAGRVLDVAADPPGTPVVSDAPGAGVGIELSPGPARVSVRIAVDGPARLDLYELHGLR